VSRHPEVPIADVIPTFDQYHPRQPSGFNWHAFDKFSNWNIVLNRRNCKSKRIEKQSNACGNHPGVQIAIGISIEPESRVGKLGLAPSRFYDQKVDTLSGNAYFTQMGAQNLRKVIE
jgi:hypothetical protein